MKTKLPTLRESRAVDYFDALAHAGQFAGFPSLALAETARRFDIGRTELAGLIRARRESENKETAA